MYCNRLAYKAVRVLSAYQRFEEICLHLRRNNASFDTYCFYSAHCYVIIRLFT